MMLVRKLMFIKKVLELSFSFVARLWVTNRENKPAQKLILA